MSSFSIYFSAEGINCRQEVISSNKYGEVVVQICFCCFPYGSIDECQDLCWR